MSEHAQIAINLDELDDEKAKEPFVFVAGGQEFTLTDPADLDWKDLLDIEHPALFFKYCMPQDQKEAFKALNISGKKLGKLVEAFQTHFGLGNQGNGAASRI